MNYSIATSSELCAEILCRASKFCERNLLFGSKKCQLGARKDTLGTFMLLWASKA
jgi:hypothetical protein